MSGADKKVMKKGTKLSLTKKSSKNEVSSSDIKNRIRNVFKGNIDLNETCEFKDPVQFSGCGDRNAQLDNGKRGKTVAKANKPEDKICIESKETVKCQVCNKNISHMTVQRREQHVNKCIDQVEVVEKQQREEQQLLEAARSAVLNCPMCGKHFKAESSRMMHLKRCCKEVGVSTEKMIQLVKEQEQERQKQLAAGIVPQQLRSKVTKLVDPKRGKIKEPKSQFAEDLQVAMAMSSSLSSACDINTGKRKKNKKAVLEDVCLLTTLTDEDRQKRIEEKVSNVLHVANYTNESVGMVLQESSLKTGSQEDTFTLWDKCSQNPVNCDSEQFYVGALIPPLSVSKTEPGKNLRRLSSIPGRENSIIKNDIPTVKIKTSEEGTEEIITASTQTAVILAELAVDDTNILDVTDPHKTDNLVDLQASGFCVEEMVLNKCDLEEQRDQTLLDYKRMVNNKEYSDVTVTSSCGQSFYAHKVILAARCPRLLQMMKDSDITLDINPDILLILLNFIYTGAITLTSSSQSELLRLAKQLEFTPLIAACNKVELKEEKSDFVNLNDNQDSSDTEFVESTLDMKEIWGESDSDLDEGEERADKVSGSDSGINESDYREISSTQHRKLRNRLSQTFTENTKSDDISNMKEKCLIDNFSIEKELKHKGFEVEDECFSHKGETADVNNDIERIDIDFVKENDEKYKDSDSDKSPSPKKLRLNNETEIDNDNEIAGTDASMQENIEGLHVESKEQNGFSRNWKQVNEVIEIDEDIAEITGMNSSTADLFESPSPKRGNVTTETALSFTNKTLFTESENKSKYSNHLEKKVTSREYVEQKELPVTAVVEIDTDSIQEDIDNVSDVGSVSDRDQVDSALQFENPVHSLNKSCDLNSCDIENEKDNKDSDVGHSYQMAEDVLDHAGCGSISSSDDDLQITGDNLDDFIQNSPTFHHKTISGTRKLNYREKIELESKYLGIKSSTERKSNLSCNMESDREGQNESKTEDKNVSGDGPGNTENNNASIPSGKQPHDAEREVSYHEEDDVKRAPRNDGRIDGTNSKAYGKHEISTYTDDAYGADGTFTADDVTAPNSSFQANNSDVWADFDDCGIDYEPPEYTGGSVSNYQPQDRNDDAMIHCEQSAESSGELSPVIPVQEVIDLSQNEDDNDICGRQLVSDVDNALLDDGDDSFVFKVSDQQQTGETPATKSQTSKRNSFKTPTAVTEHHGKKRQWEPPSPFTPMPEYGSMPTPALKKAVQRYGVKPVGKKRMIKVLEDIYHQTHQYETDSECEEEVQSETVTPLYGGGGGEGDNMPSSSQGDISSQDSDISDVLEESCLHMSSDSDTSSSPQKKVEVTRQLFQFIKTRPEIHARILMYEPLELDVLKKDVKDSGIKCSMDKLMDFLDERCIAFTSKNSRNRQASKRGKQKTSKSKKNNSQSEN